MGRDRGLCGACEPHVSLTHVPELNCDWEGERRDGNVLEGWKCAACPSLCVPRRGFVILWGAAHMWEPGAASLFPPRYGGTALGDGGMELSPSPAHC